MTFTSIAFLVFFAAAVVGFYISPVRFRWAWLLLLSAYFYMAFVPKYILILSLLITIDYTVAILLERTAGRTRHALFLLSIVANVGILFVFKYFNFFNENVAALAKALGWNYGVGTLRLLLPLGLSFHTFQSLSYIIEVYKGKYKAEWHLGVYALYVLFFPQLVAGPIERPQHLLTQLNKLDARFSFANIKRGVRLMAWGFFKKLVIADRVAQLVDYVWLNAAHLPGPSMAFAMVFFAIQLYADFSGYSDIARGSAQALGVEVVRNFEQPYFSRSIAEFWRRWHISLSSWFRDYFFLPLSFTWRRFVWGSYLAIIATFLVTGLWHGAGWTFVIMGLLYGIYIVSGLLSRRLREAMVRSTGLGNAPRLHRALQMLFTFALVCLGWVFFRAPNLGQAMVFLSRLDTGWALPLQEWYVSYFQHPFDMLGVGQSDLLIAAGAVVVVVWVEYIETKEPVGTFFDRQNAAVRSFGYASLALALILFSVISMTPFIYFQF